MLEMKLTTLPGYTPKYSSSGLLQACMGVTGDEFNAVQTSLGQALQKAAPVHFLT